MGMSRIAYTKQLYNKGQVMTEYTQVPNKLITLKIPPAEKAVLLVIARFTYGYQRTQCELSISQIADHASISRRSAFNIIAALENNGFLSVVRGKADGINTMNSYQIIDLYSGAEFAPPSANNSLGVVQNLHIGSAEFAPSKESIKENINNIPPIVPPQGDVSDSSLASQAIELAETVIEPVEPESKPIEPAKRTHAKRGEITEATELTMKELINDCDCKHVPKGFLLSYLKYRHTVIKKPIKSTQGLQAQINVLAELSSKEAMEAAIKHTMDNEWIKIVVPSASPKTSMKSPFCGINAAWESHKATQPATEDDPEELARLLKEIEALQEEIDNVGK
ncbi:MAG: hypothetical protein E6Q83_03650 [Thiothrix sp.]|nr:MAG: hypothetical protein E6Q83_03650 [Thiothrix sp.]